MFLRLLRYTPAAALLFAALWAPLPSAAQSDPTQTPVPSAKVAATPTLTSTPTASFTATATTTATVVATAAVVSAGTNTAAETVTPAALAAVTASVTDIAGTGPLTATVRTGGNVRLRVRTGPGTSYPIVMRLNNGQTVTLLGRDARGGWVLIAVPGQNTPSGWVSASYLVAKGAISQLPVSSTLPAAKAVAGTAPVPGPAGSTVAQGVVPAPGPLPGKIAVPVFDASQGIYNIWMVDANGANLRLVVTNASSPALSADGTLLAYRHWQRDDRGIVVANSDGSNPLRITDKLEDVLPSFSPDKTKIVFSTYRQGDRLSRIYYVWTDEQNHRAWEWGAGGLFGEDPDWMTDTQIAYHKSGETDQLWLMNGDSTDQRPFYTTSSIAAIAASSDSRTVAYMSDSDGNWDIYSVGTGGSNAQRLTTDPAQDGLPAWSPDGKSIAFVSDRSGQWALWVMDSDGSNQRMLAMLPGSVDGRVQFEPDYLNHGWLEEQIAWSW